MRINTVFVFSFIVITARDYTNHTLIGSDKIEKDGILLINSSYFS